MSYFPQLSQGELQYIADVMAKLIGEERGTICTITITPKTAAEMETKDEQPQTA